MALEIYSKSDCDISVLNSKKVAIIGFGSQGHAHALNLRDNGVDVIIGQRKGKSYEYAKSLGFDVYEICEAVKMADLVMILLPDELQAEIYKTQIEPNLKKDSIIAFAHGFNIHFKQIEIKDHDTIMIAPKGPGHGLRSEFLKGSGLVSLIAVANDVSKNALKYALAYAKGIGSDRVGIIKTTFKDECETDLFGEQAVLCGGICDLVKMGFDTLVEAGYEKEMAYFECVHEVKLIADLLYTKGLLEMKKAISNTAEFGGCISGEKLITKDTKDKMKEILKNIQNGKFAKEFIDEFQNGYKISNSKREALKDSDIENTGKKIRSLVFANGEK